MALVPTFIAHSSHEWWHHLWPTNHTIAAMIAADIAIMYCTVQFDRSQCLIKSSIRAKGQGSRFNVHTLASGQTMGFVLNTWPKTDVHTPCTLANKGVFKQCSDTVFTQ